ncbi:hypothetical protein [Paenibacillus tyrfis]|uniref:hypothetical protein n=1 Tax=Paenibacillus tyrfis TaxID=1501230 RepID=UPI0020A1DC01|nr:hypothetical protein [Paenibacillus tyrfis]MCP1306451.1 hypothetical protein [Paenibacillus tyrfis]
MERLRTTKRQPKSLPLKKDRQVVPRINFQNIRLNKCSRRKMALDLRVTEETIRKIEYGTLDPSIMMAYVYSAYLRTPVDELFPDIVAQASEYYASLEAKFEHDSQC